MATLKRIAERSGVNLDKLLDAGARLDLRDLDELLEVAVVAPRIEAVKFLDGETGEKVACELRPEAEYIIIDRVMAVELVLRAMLLKQANDALRVVPA